jgi:hypothetical protein
MRSDFLRSSAPYRRSVIINEKRNHMKQIILIAMIMSFGTIQYGQIINNEFDNWILIETGGQPYLDLVSWQTNNTNSTVTSLATTPSFKITVNGDNGVSVITDFQGIDGISSGHISQTISTGELNKINYFSKCDSIYERGACVVNIYNAANNIIFTDSIKQKEIEYSNKTIEINELSLNESDLIKIEFVGFGSLGPWEEFQAYSEFNILNVKADYISKTKELKQVERLKIYPNPFSNIIQIEANKKIPKYNLYCSTGTLIEEGLGRTLDLSNLTNGLYFLEIIMGDINQIEKIIKH